LNHKQVIITFLPITYQNWVFTLQKLFIKLEQFAIYFKTLILSIQLW